MPQVTKPMQIRIRVADEDVEVLESLAGKTLPIATVASSLLSASIEAVRQNQGRLSFPPALQVCDVDPGRAVRRTKGAR